MIEQRSVPSQQSASACKDAHRATSGAKPDDIDPASIRTELARLFGVAALRLRRRVALSPNCPPNAPKAAPSGEKPPETAPNPLEVPADRSVHGDRVVDAPERLQPGGSS